MDRRDFLKGALAGTVVGLASSTDLIVRATEAEILQFANEKEGESVVVGGTHPIPHVGNLIFNHLGQPIGVIHNIEVKVDAIDITTAQDNWQRFAPGRRSVWIHAIAPGPFKVGK